MTHNQVNSWVCATIPMAGTVTYDCIPEVQIPPRMTLLRAFECLVPSMTKTTQTERKRQRRRQRQRQIPIRCPYSLHLDVPWPPSQHKFTLCQLWLSLWVSSPNSKSQCQKLSPWFLAGKLNGAWSVTEARKCSEVFEPLGCIASLWTPLHSFLMSQIIMQA